MIKGYEMAIGDDVKTNVEEKVIKHRNDYTKIMRARYRELLPELFTYRTDSKKVKIDWTRLEFGLRNGYDMVVGLCTDNVIRLMGYTVAYNYSNDINFMGVQPELDKSSIIPIIKDILIPNNAKEITVNHSGDFVVVRNKPVSYVSDYNIIDFYIEELAEIVVSRFSLSIQLKVITFFTSEAGSEDGKNLEEHLMNGATYAQVSPLFDPNENIHIFDSTGASENLVELKREYQNKLSELNNILGVNSVGVEKNSGVSDSEVNANNGYVGINDNIYLSSRQKAFKLLEEQFGIKITPMLNDSVISMLALKEIMYGSGDNATDNNNNGISAK